MATGSRKNDNSIAGNGGTVERQAWPHETLLPWHRDLWPALMGQSVKNGGLLLSGPSGHGKRFLARRLTQSLLCERPLDEGHPCGHCTGCRLFQVNQHPDCIEIVTEQHWDDFVRLRTEDADGGDSGRASSGASASGSEREQKVARDIRIADIRRLERLTTLSAHRGGRRVVLIWPADEMTTEASNALLKTLEEPGQGLHFILVSAHPARLLPTVRSRVRIQECPGATREQALKWLTAQGIPQAESALGLSMGAPLRAQMLGQQEEGEDSIAGRDAFVRWLLDPASSSADRPASFDKLGLGPTLQLMILTAYEVLRVGEGSGTRHLHHLHPALQSRKPPAVRGLHEFVRDCLDFMPHSEHPLNIRMQMDALTQRWFECINPALRTSAGRAGAGRA